MRNQKLLSTLLVVAMAAAVWIGAGRQRRAAPHDICPICQRPVLHKSRVEVERDGKREAACCPSCLLAFRAQTGRKVRLVSVTDFDSGTALPPAQAAYVVGSDADTCAGQAQVKVDQTKHPMPAHYDRCTPGIAAFSNRRRATEFARLHGGNVATLRDLGVRDDYDQQPGMNEQGAHEQ